MFEFWSGSADPPTHKIGYLKAIWPDLLGELLRSGRPRGPGKAFKNVGGEAPHLFEGFPRPPGPARIQKRTPTNPARLPSGTRFETRPAAQVMRPSAHDPQIWSKSPGNSLAVEVGWVDRLGTLRVMKAPTDSPGIGRILKIRQNQIYKLPEGQQIDNK